MGSNKGNKAIQKLIPISREIRKIEAEHWETIKADSDSAITKHWFRLTKEKFRLAKLAGLTNEKLKIIDLI